VDFFAVGGQADEYVVVRHEQLLKLVMRNSWATIEALMVHAAWTEIVSFCLLLWIGKRFNPCAAQNAQNQKNKPRIIAGFVV
jgi:hypothetical protein